MYPPPAPDQHNMNAYGDPSQGSYGGHPPPYTSETSKANWVPLPTDQAIVITTQSNIMVVPQPVYKHYLGLSLVSLALCFPLGIVALFYSLKVKDSMSRGDKCAVESQSRTTFTINMVAVVLGIIVNLGWIAYVGYRRVP